MIIIISSIIIIINKKEKNITPFSIIFTILMLHFRNVYCTRNREGNSKFLFHAKNKRRILLFKRTGKKEATRFSRKIIVSRDVVRRARENARTVTIIRQRDRFEHVGIFLSVERDGKESERFYSWNYPNIEWPGKKGFG